MAWMKVETSVSRNRKFVKAGPGPSWLWLCGLAYSKESLTDGFIPDEALEFLGVRSARNLVKHLVSAGLWDVVDGGWRIHDYFDHNKSAADVKAETDSKVEAGRKGGKASGEARREAAFEAPASNTSKHPANPEESRSDQSREETESSRGARPSPLVARRRLDAAFEYGRLYVPQRAHDDLMMLGNHGQSEKALFDWYEAICEDYTNGSKANTGLPTNLIAFWKAKYEERWPADKVAAPSRLPAWAQR